MLTTKISSALALTAAVAWSTLFAPAPGPHPASQITPIYSFQGGADGASPNGSLVSDAAGNLYGVTFAGGSENCIGGCGTVFELTPSSGTWEKTTIFNFEGNNNGGNPLGGLIFDGSGNLYGVTTPGNGGYGTIYELSPSQGVWKETTLSSISSESGPVAGLAFDGQGNLYGTTSGSVFELSSSNGHWIFTTIHTFGGIDGSFTQSGVMIDRRGSVYGTTYQGGYNDWGDVFKLMPTNRGWIETMNAAVGRLDSGVILDSKQDVYGVTPYYGQNNEGFAYELTLSNGFWAVSVLYNFGGFVGDGEGPVGIVHDPNTRSIYGATYGGGIHGLGTVYQLASIGGVWNEKVLASFNGSNGQNPASGVIFDQAGNLYGTTSEGGTANMGVVYEVTR